MGDWFRDPWGWPELDWVVSTRPDFIEARIESTDVRAVSKIDVPKENFGIRPAMVMDPLDRLAYQALVGHLSVPLIGGMHRNAYGWRLPLKGMTPGVYSPGDKQWENYRSYLSRLAGEFEVALKTDIVSCFASIPIDRLIEEIERKVTRASSRPIADNLFARLVNWNRITGRSGIPQRFQASAVLANLYLSQLDEVLDHHSSDVDGDPGKRRSFVRWMDDVWLFGDDAGNLRRAQVEINSALNDLGLHMNSGKTELLEGGQVAVSAREVEHSAIDEELLFGKLLLLRKKRLVTKRLDELVERLVDAKETASRTSIKFATTRMRTYKHFEKVDDFIEVAMRMPQGADALARLFRDAKKTGDMEDWYIDYLGKPWSKVEWAAAQLGTMFPSTGGVGRPIQDEFASILSRGGSSLPMTAVAAQRLAKWNRKEARVVIAEAIKRADNPLHRRVLALAGLEAGCSRTAVTKWLSEFAENAVTLELLQDRSFRKLPLKPDFIGS
ncbi:RNA-directed DNA polymerase [Micromonospora sp. WMMC250]|uniref:RNA-directed DNA polymerase n=1 Tax=Micromonospora sp. WMMC250 TaxID=3014781 RepID=UPI0022B6804E|nr:RNA-directed DNA polymerase [Micromonospora sp. WMMC250]MCZ7379175.1 RNA-directed DNA polymerase [Micromonospora sp. WMMC250]